MKGSTQGRETGGYYAFRPRPGCRLYLRRQLRRRGLRHTGRLAEGLELALHLFSIEAWQTLAHQEDRRAWRSLLDRIVHQALRELRPTAPRSLDGKDMAGQPEARYSEGVNLLKAIERLPVPLRLVAKLKFAEVFYPRLRDGPPDWTWDEAEYLQELHPATALDELNAILLTRLAQHRRSRAAKVPSEVIAWLLRRASANAVDVAFRELKARCRHEAHGDGHPPSPASHSPRESRSRESVGGRIKKHRENLSSSINFIKFHLCRVSKYPKYLDSNRRLPCLQGGYDSLRRLRRKRWRRKYRQDPKPEAAR